MTFSGRRGETMRAAAHIRVSTENQAEEGKVSLVGQQGDIEEATHQRTRELQT